MQYQLPTLQQLHAANLQEVVSDDRVLAFLNQDPVQAWIKYHPTVKVKNEQNQQVPLAYLPIDKVELMMTTIFRKWRAEIIKVEPMFNSIVIHTRVFFLWPGTENDWRWVDGIGAQGIQTDKGATAMDLSAMKFSAVQIAAPAAFSFAKKDACENIGRIFGRDLNKSGVIAFEPFGADDIAQTAEAVTGLKKEPKKKADPKPQQEIPQAAPPQFQQTEMTFPDPMFGNQFDFGAPAAAVQQAAQNVGPAAVQQAVNNFQQATPPVQNNNHNPIQF